MNITVPGSGIWPPVVVTIDAAGQIWLDQAEDRNHIVLDPADLDALIRALQTVYWLTHTGMTQGEQANG